MSDFIQVKGNDTVCGCSNCNDGYEFLRIKNHLREFNTEVAKAEARFNLGIPDEWNLKWGNITGYIEQLEDLKVYMENFTEEHKKQLLELFDALQKSLIAKIETLSQELHKDIDEQKKLVELTRQEVIKLINDFDKLKKELIELINSKVDKSELDNIKNPFNHPYNNPENSLIQNVKQALDVLLYKPLVINLTINPLYVEIGDTIKSTSINWSYNKSNIIELKLNGQVLSNNIRSKTDATTINSNKKYTLQTNDGTNTISKSIDMIFTEGKYYGVCNHIPTSLDVVSTFIKDLLLRKGSVITVNPQEGLFIYLMVPKSMNDLKFKVGGFEGGFLIINNNFLFTKFGKTYYNILYRSDLPNLGKTTIYIV